MTHFDNLREAFDRSSSPSVAGVTYAEVYGSAARDAAKCDCETCAANLLRTPLIYSLALLATVGPADEITTQALKAIHKFVAEE